MTRTVSEKMGIKEKMRAFFVQAPEGVLETMELPELEVAGTLSGNFNYLHVFVITQEDFNEHVPRLKKHLAAGGMLWVSWPKNKQLGTDLTLIKVIEWGYNFGLVESTCLSIDDTWSALKFTHPKDGKLYNNSYGKLRA